MTVSLGLDPGAKGGLAAIHANTGWVEVVSLATITDHEAYCWILDRTQWYGDSAGVRGTLEAIRARPGIPGSSICKLAASYGLLRGFLVAAGCPWEEYTPSVWMRAQGVPTGLTAPQRLRWIRQRCQQLYPATKVTDHTAAALLLAHHGRMQ